MRYKIKSNLKLLLSILGTVFGHPAMIVFGAYLTIALQEYLKLNYDLNLNIIQSSINIIIFPLALLFLTFVRYCFFYFWNYEKIKYLSFIDGFKFFISFQLYQIIFIPFYIYLQVVSFHYSEGIVLIYYFLSLLILSIFVFIYMQIKLYKYEKFDLNKEIL